MGCAGWNFPNSKRRKKRNRSSGRSEKSRGLEVKIGIGIGKLVATEWLSVEAQEGFKEQRTTELGEGFSLFLTLCPSSCSRNCYTGRHSYPSSEIAVAPFPICHLFIKLCVDVELFFELLWHYSALKHLKIVSSSWKGERGKCYTKAKYTGIFLEVSLTSLLVFSYSLRGNNCEGYSSYLPRYSVCCTVPTRWDRKQVEASCLIFLSPSLSPSLPLFHVWSKKNNLNHSNEGLFSFNSSSWCAGVRNALVIK